MADGWPRAATSPRDAVKLWDLVAHRELLSLQGEGQYFMHVAFSPDGNTLAAVSLDGIAHLWRAPSWEEIEAAEKGTDGAMNPHKRTKQARSRAAKLLECGGKRSATPLWFSAERFGRVPTDTS